MWRSILRPLAFLLPAERAHYWSMNAFSLATALPPTRHLVESLTRLESPRLASRVCGLLFPNPVGLAAGFDKDARWYHRMDSLGFGFVEVGSITGEGQPGNPKPRLFRLPKDQALINRMGFNNSGSSVAAQNLASTNDRRFRSRSVLGINIGKTKVVDLENAADDYAKSFRALQSFADFFVINVSSPNTPGLRDLQEKEPLQHLLRSIEEWNHTPNDRLKNTTQDMRPVERRPVFLKIAPDLTDGQLDDVCEISLQPYVDGVIATNTTIARTGLKTPQAAIESIGAGGLSGRPLFNRSCEVVNRLYQKIGNQKPIIGVGGIFDGEDAWQMITNGASLIELYTGFIYGGPRIVRHINQTLIAKLDEHGFRNISEAVGFAQR